MRVRKASLRDYAELKQIRTEFYLWECERDKRIDRTYARHLGPTLAKMMRQKNKAFFVAEDKGAIGYAAAEIQKNPSWCVHKKRGHLFNIYIKKEYRKKGIGKKLTEACLRWFKDNKVKDLIIMHYFFNKEAKNLYKKYGFREYITILTRN